jgi:hypothetical protein
VPTEAGWCSRVCAGQPMCTCTHNTPVHPHAPGHAHRHSHQLCNPHCTLTSGPSWAGPRTHPHAHTHTPAPAATQQARNQPVQPSVRCPPQGGHTGGGADWQQLSQPQGAEGTPWVQRQRVFSQLVCCMGTAAGSFGCPPQRGQATKQSLSDLQVPWVSTAPSSSYFLGEGLVFQGRFFLHRPHWP